MSSDRYGDTQRQQLHDDGFCIVPNVLTGREVEDARKALDDAAEEARRRGFSTYTDFMDPNANNVRVYNLPEFDPLFSELLRRPLALEIVQSLIGANFLISSFTANIALPGSGQMNLHSDLSVVAPPPWNEPWSINIIWCLHDTHEKNGATRYLPGSHRYRTMDEVPADAMARTRPFEAKAGSIIVMDGRVWHTSGKNVTANERRALMFAYYTVDFLRQQVNWEAALSPATKDKLDDQMRILYGLGPGGNVRMGGEIVTLKDFGAVDARARFGAVL